MLIKNLPKPNQKESLGKQIFFLVCLDMATPQPVDKTRVHDDIGVACCCVGGVCGGVCDGNIGGGGGK